MKTLSIAAPTTPALETPGIPAAHGLRDEMAAPACRNGTLCVVIPAYNEELLVGRCIASVLDAGVAPGDIYVVDDCSKDGTAARVRDFRGVNLLSNERQRGKLGGFQDAVERFRLTERYEFLALLDADSRVDREYFRAVRKRFADADNIVLVSGAPHSDPYNGLTAYRAVEYAVTLRVFRKGQDAMGVINVAPGCASTYRTRILPHLDWNGGTLVEDMDLTVQIHRRCLGRVAYTADAIAYTQDPRTLREYIGQLTRWYSGTWQVVRLRRIPFGGQRIDAEFALLLAEGMVYSVIALMAPIIAFVSPGLVLRLLLLDQALWFALACISAVLLRRADVVLYFPMYIGLRMINSVVLLRTFWSEVVRARRLDKWFTVSRYDRPPDKTAE